MIFVVEAVKRFFSGIGAYLLAGVAIVGGVLMILMGAKKAGKDEVRADTAGKEVANARDANEIEDRVATSTPDDRRERLRKYFRD